MGRRPEFEIFLKKVCRWLIVHAKTVNIANQRNQTKTAMRYHLTPVRTAVVKKSRNNKRRGCWKKGTLAHCWWECKLVQALWKTKWRFLKNEN